LSSYFKVLGSLIVEEQAKPWVILCRFSVLYGDDYCSGWGKIMGSGMEMKMDFVNVLETGFDCSI